MTVFGLIWLVILLIFTFKRDIKYLTFLTLFSMVIQCSNVIEIGGTGIGPQVITSIVFFLRALFTNNPLKEKKTHKINVLCVLFIISIFISTAVNGLLSSSMMKMLQLISYIFCFIAMGKIASLLENDFFYKSMKYITYFVAIMGVVQVLLTSGLVPQIGLVKMIFYNEDASYVYFNHANYKRLMSTFMEPSYCGCFLVGSFLYFLSTWDENHKHLPLLIVLGVETILTTSSTAYGALVIGALAFLLLGNNTYAKKKAIPIAIAAGLFLFIFAFDTIDHVILSKGSSGSANTRYYWNVNAIKAFQSSMFLGTGYKSVRGSSLFLSIAGELGLLGISIYLLYNLFIVLPTLSNNANKPYSDYGIRFAILGVIVAQFIACPDLDLCVYWMFMYFFAIYVNRKKEVKEKEVINYETV